jgi:hypothetical protein
MLFLAAAVTCVTWLANPNPHIIRDADDAVATAFANYNPSLPSSLNRKSIWPLWKQAYSAQRNGDVWELIPNDPAARARGDGLALDANTGCIVSISLS